MIMRRKLGAKEKFFIALCIFVLVTNPALVYSLPEGEQVVSGSADFDRSTQDTLHVNTPSDRLIVNYDSFSIAQPEAVHFHQPSSDAIALNRVVGHDPSAILGLLTANGRIFIVNPNGVLFGEGARVDTAGLLASTLDISNANFLNGHYNFFNNGNSSFILNQGKITVANGGYAILLAQGIENQGSIQADLGKAILASGEKITLALDDLSQISVVVDEGVKEEVFGVDGQKLDSAIKNSGSITADGGKVTLTAKALNKVFDNAINNTGIIQANSLVSHNGEVELSAEAAAIYNIGKIAAGGSNEAPDAGKVSIAGGEIIQQGEVSANAAEAGNAGQVSIISANQVTLVTGSVTEAKAEGLAGEGGNILIDSTAGNTVVNAGAVIDVSAGSVAGNAGSVEVSALKVLDFSGIINGRAPLGYLGGVAVLDPEFAEISGTLNANTTVWATEDITITGAVIIDGDYTLNLFADHNSPTAGDWEDGIGAILNPFDNRIEASSGTDTTLNLKAGSGIGIDNPITTRDVHTITAEINPFFGAGDINLVSDQADVSLTLGGLFTPSGNINVENRSNDPIILDSVDFGLFPYAVETWDGSVSITNVGSIDIPGTNSDGISATGDITLLASDGTANITAGSEFAITAAISIFGNISFDAGNNIDLGQAYSADILADEGDLILTAGNNITLDNGSMASSTIGDITVTADNNISLAVLETTGDVTVTANTGTGIIIDNNGEGVNNITANDLYLTAALGINLDTSVDTLTASSTDTAITIREADGLAVNTVNAITGNIFLTLASGSITDNNLGVNNIIGNGLTAIAASGINLDTNIESLIASVTEAGNILIDEASGIDLASIDTLDGSITITAGGEIIATDVASLTDRDVNDISLTGVGIVAGSIDAGNAGDVMLNAQTGSISEDADLLEDVIADNLQLNADNGIDLDTSVNTLTASSANTDIAIREADDIAIDTVNAGAGNVDLASAFGSISDNNDVANNVTGNNLILTADTGVDLDTTVTSLDAILTGAGDLTIREANEITLTTIDVLGGSIDVTAGSTITAIDLLALDPNGNIILTANTGDIVVDTLEAGNTVELSALLGSIIDDNSGLNNVTATNLVATGANGIDLDTTVETLTAATTDSSIAIREADDVAVNTIEAGIADVDLSSLLGSITDNNGGSNNVSANNLILTAETGIDLDTNINSLDAIVNSTGDLTIDELNDIILTALDVIDGDIVVNAGDAITANNLLALDTGLDGVGGNISLNADLGDINVDTIEADGTVDLSASSGAIVDINDINNNIIADSLILTAGLGVDLDTEVNSLDAIITDTGDLFIDEADDISLTADVINGDINVNAGNTITANDLMSLDTDADGMGGYILLNASAGDISLGTLTADYAVDLVSSLGAILDNNAGVNNVTTNDLFLSAPLGIELDTEVATLTAATTNADITIREADDIAINTIDAGTANVDLTSTSGSISDDNDIATNVTANNLVLTANAGADLDTNVNSLDAILTGNGNLVIDEFDGITLTSLDLVGGDIDITAGGSIEANNLLTLDSNGNIILTTTIGDITIGELSAGGSIILTALTGAINEIGLGDAEVDLTSSIIDLFAKDEIGSAVDELDIETDADILSAESTNNQDIVITEENDVAIDTITTGKDVYLSSLFGSISDANGELINNITANSLILTTEGDVDLDTEIATLDAILFAGDLTLREADAITLTTIDVTGGSIDITAGSTITAIDLLALDPNGNIILTANTGDIVVDTLEAGNTVELSALLGSIIDDNSGLNNVTATNLVATGANGIDLDTTVETLTAATTDTNITIREADDVAVNTIEAGIADVDLSSLLGSITDNNGGSNNVTANTLTLTAETGIDLDTNINSLDAIVNSTGDLAIDELNDIILTALDVIDGDIVLTAGGEITTNNLLAMDTDLNGIGGNISLSADLGDILVDTIEADGTVDLSASLGSIVDLNGSGINNVAANSLILTADTGINLDTAVNSLDAIVTGTGDLFINEADNIALTAIDVINGDIIVDAGDAIIAGNLLALDSDADGIGGNISLTANSGDITLGELTADYSVDLYSVFGAINDDNLDANNASANELILTANSGIDLDSQVNFLNAQTASGDIDISNDTALLTIDDFSLGNGVGVFTDNGNVAIANTGSIDMPGTNGDGIYATGDITLASSEGNITAGSEDWITAAWSDNGSITLNANNDIYLGEIYAADLLISNGIGSINLTTTLGDITIDNGTNINSIEGDINLTSGNDINLLESLQGGTLIISDASGNITLDAANNIDLGVLETAGDVELIANSGAITDNNLDATNVTANNLVLTANSGVDLDTNVNSLDAILTGNGNLVIDEFDGITLTSLDLVGGDIDITAGGSIEANNLLTLDSNGNIILTTTIGDITIGELSAGGSIILTALTGAINEIGAGDAEVDLTSSVIDLFANDEIGSAVDELDIEIDADILSAESTNNQDIAITEDNDVSVDTITTGGDVYLSSLLGRILDANGELINNITAASLILTADDDVDLDTTVDILDAIITGNGSLTIREADDVSLYAIDVLGGNVNISAGNILTITDSLLTNGGNLILSAANGILQEQIGDIDTAGGSYTANADSNNDYAGTYRLASGGSIYTQDIDGNGGDIEITAADIDLGSGSLLEAGNGDISLLPSFDGLTPLTIGLGNAAGDFRLDNDELDALSTLGRVIIGDENSGNILVREVAPLGFSDLMLVTGGNINDIAGQLGIAISRLRLEAGTGIGESINPLDINVDSLNASTASGSIFIDEEDNVELEELTAPDSIQLNANGEIGDGNADLMNINTLDLLITAGNGIGDLEDAIETEIETIDAYAANGGIFIDELDDLALNLVDANGGDVMLTTGGSLLDNDLGAAPDDFDILGANITLDVGGHIGSAGEEEEVDLDLDTLLSLTENSRPDAPTDLDSLSHASGVWSNNNLVDVAWTAAINPNFYTGSDNSIAGYSFVWDDAAGTIPDEIQDIGDVTSLNDILLADSNGTYLHIRSLNSSGNWSEAIHLGPFQIDTVAPEITATRNSGPNINGWYNGDVMVTFSGIDDRSGIDSITAPIIISTEGQGQSVIGTITDLAGNSVSITEGSINIDKTAPVISSSRNVGPNASGWNNSDVTVNFSGSDDLSGVSSITGPLLISSEGEGQSVIGTITDLAGNSVSITESNINIDKTAPVISITNPVSGSTSGVPQALLFTASDNLSPASALTLTGPASGTVFNASGTQNLILTATDLAGNSVQQFLTFTISSDFAESQIASSSIINNLFFSNPQQLGQFQSNSFDVVGPVFFYHPLTPIDMSAMSNEIVLEEGAYEFIEDSINLKGVDEGGIILEDKNSDKKEDKNGKKKEKKKGLWQFF